MSFFKIVDKYLAREFIKPFFVALFILVIILISSFLFELTDYIIIREIPVATVLKLLFYRLPEYIVRAISMAVLFATLLSLGRLVKDNELSSFRIGGISFPRLIVPLVVLGLFISGANYLFNERVVPRANTRYQEILRYSVEQREDPEVRENVLFKGGPDRYLYIGYLNTKTGELRDIVVYDQREEKNEFMTANTGFFQERRISLDRPVRHILDGDNYVESRRELEGKTYNFREQITDLYASPKKPAEMSRRELRNRIRVKREAGGQTREMEVEYHFKLAEPLACLIFVLVGAPLSVKSNKGRIFGVITSVVIIFIYYVFLSFGQSLGRVGALSPFVAVWMPNMIFALIGGGLIIRESIRS